MPSHLRALVTFGSLIVLLVVAAAASTAAVADCVGPQLTYRGGEARRGEALAVEGSAFGDSCHDTGPPPEGQGVLGNPLQDIEIFIRHDGTDHVVARGSADADYDLATEVVVPAELDPGPVVLEARTPDRVVTFEDLHPVLDVTDDPPTSMEPPGEIPRFGPETTSTTVPQDGLPDTGTDGRMLDGIQTAVLVGASVAAGIGAATVIVRRRRRAGDGGDRATGVTRAPSARAP